MPVRSVLKCEAPSGVCQACYGRSMATGKLAQIGDAVGHHRRPVDRRAGHAADHADVPHRRRRRRGHHARPAARRRAVRGAQAQGPGQDRRAGRRGLDRGDRQGAHGRRSPTTPARSTATRSRAARGCSSSDGEKIEAGTQLNEGSLYPHELLAIRGRTETELYLVKEVQEVYKSQGVDINDKHIELIVRQMLKKVRVDQKGDTDYLPGPVRRPLRVRARSTTRVKKASGEQAAGRGDHPRDHQGLAEHRLVPVGGLLPGDHQGAHRRGARGQDRPPERAQGERDHRQADPGRDRAQALPADRDRAVRAAAARRSTTSACSTRTRSPPSSGSPTATALDGGFGQEFDADLASLEKIGAGGTRPGLRRGARRARGPRRGPGRGGVGAGGEGSGTPERSGGGRGGGGGGRGRGVEQIG